MDQFLEDLNLHWRLVPPKEAANVWDGWLKQHGIISYHQLFEYGFLKQSQGWRVMHFSSRIRSPYMAQVFVRTYPMGTAVAWLPGINDLWNNEAVVCGFYKFLQVTLRLPRLYLRISFMDHLDGQSIQTDIQGLSRPTIHLGSSLSMEYNPCIDENVRFRQASKNWRHNLRRSNKYKLNTYLWNDPDKDMIVELYSSMEKYKGLSQQFSPNDISVILTSLAENLLIVRCDNENGDLIAIRGCIYFENKGWDFFAAASVEGRKKYASYACYWGLMNECNNRGVDTYNLGGVDPENNTGVYNFKKGTGAQLIQYRGEYEISNSMLLSKLINFKLGVDQK